MYKSPIDIIISDIQIRAREQQEKQIYEAVQKVGVNVDKTELIKALNYDREQYHKGFLDGYIDGIIAFAEDVKALFIYDNQYDIRLQIDELAEEKRSEINDYKNQKFHN